MISFSLTLHFITCQGFAGASISSPFFRKAWVHRARMLVQRYVPCHLGLHAVVTAGPRAPLIHDARAMTRQWMRTVVKYQRKTNEDLSIDGKMRMHPWKMKMEMKRLM